MTVFLKVKERMVKVLQFKYQSLVMIENKLVFGYCETLVLGILRLEELRVARLTWNVLRNEEAQGSILYRNMYNFESEPYGFLKKKKKKYFSEYVDWWCKTNFTLDFIFCSPIMISKSH